MLNKIWVELTSNIKLKSRENLGLNLSKIIEIRRYTAIILLLSSGVCYGQGPKFQLYLTKSCSGKEQLDTSYYLIPVNNYDTAFFPKSGTVYLPATGHYIIGFNRGPICPIRKLTSQTRISMSCGIKSPQYSYTKPAQLTHRLCT